MPPTRTEFHQYICRNFLQKYPAKEDAELFDDLSQVFEPDEVNTSTDNKSSEVVAPWIILWL